MPDSVTAVTAAGGVRSFHSHSRGRFSLLAVVAATAVLWTVSRGKWSDAIIDSGREWIVPDALSRGELLYRDVVYWFGPFTPYFQALFFRVFGSSFETLVLSGAVAACGALASLFLALRRVTGRGEALLATALAVPVFVFMPNAGGPLLGMGYRIWHAAVFALLAIALACRGSDSWRGQTLRLVLVGALAGLAGLCRTEWGLVTLVAALLCRLRMTRGRRLSEALPILGGFLLLFGGGLLFFIARAGASAVLRDGHVLLTGLPAETRTFVIGFSTLAEWKTGVLELLYSAGMWLGAFLLIALFAARRPGSEWPRARVWWLIGLLAVLGLLALMGGVRGAVLFSAAPLVCLATLVAGLRLRAGPRAGALCGFGLTGLLLSYRRPFHIGDSGYVGPPLLFGLVCSMALLRLAVAAEKNGFARRRLRRALSGSLVALTALAFIGRLIQYAPGDQVPVPGTGGMLSAGPRVVRELTGLALAIARQTPSSGGLVVFPEGEVLNFLSRRRNPIRHKLYLPGYLTSQNEAEVLAELERARPAAVVVLWRLTSEYGPGSFGGGYGAKILEWLERNYASKPWQRERTFPPSKTRLYLLRGAS